MKQDLQVSEKLNHKVEENMCKSSPIRNINKTNCNLQLDNSEPSKTEGIHLNSLLHWRLLIPSAIKHIHVKTTLGYYFTLTKMSRIIIIIKQTSGSKEVEKLELSYIAGRDIKWYNSLKNSLASPQKLKQIFLFTQKLQFQVCTKGKR